MKQRTNKKYKIPNRLSTNELLMIGQSVHQMSSAALSPHANAKAPYQAMSLILQTLTHANQKLEAATQRKQPVNPLDKSGKLETGEWVTDGFSSRKRLLYEKRRDQMQRIRRIISLQLEQDNKEMSRAALSIQAAIHERKNDFESLPYQTSHQEFDLFIEEFEGSNFLKAALELLKLKGVYTRMRQSHCAFLDLCANERQPSQQTPQAVVNEHKKDVRHAIKVLITHLQFDIDHGDDTFLNLMREIEKIILVATDPQRVPAAPINHEDNHESHIDQLDPESELLS